jgi:hypothetical protein
MLRRLLYTRVLAALLVSTTVIGCAPVTVQQTTLQHTYTDVRADVVTTGALSQMTQQALRMQGLQVTAQEPQQAFQDLDARSAPQPDDDQQVALAEIALSNAMHNESSNPTTAADWYLLAAARSYDFVTAKASESSLFDLRYERMRVFYLRAIAGFVQQLKSASGSFAAHQRTISGQQYAVDIASGPGLFDPNTFDELLFAAEMDFEGLANRHRRFGLGLSLVGFRKNTLAQPADHYFPKVGTTWAVTVLLRFEPAAPGEPLQRRAHLCFYDALNVETIALNGVQVPFAADFTAPFGLLISRGRLKSIGLSQTLSSQNWTKTAVSDSGDQLWERTFQKRSADLELSAALRQQLDRLLRFQRAPFITRVVFICVPHRGSLLAESFAGRIGRMLIAVPASVLTPVRLLTEQAGTALAPDMLVALQEDPTSIRGLSPQNPMIQALAGVAIDKGVPFHSIIGDRGLGDGEQGSDGGGPYKSSHLEGAESELIVPSDHAATAHPFTVLEVKRILKLHLQQAGLPSS